MATVIETPGISAREERFFFVMAWVMAATIAAGFGFNLAMGRSSFGMPPIFHIHAFVFFGWVVLYLVQNGLVASGSVALHRRLGWLAVIWVPAMVALGTLMTLISVRRGGPPFFAQNEFLFGNPAQLLAFAALVYWAISVRKDTGWHRRLMFCAMTILTGPGLGRLLPTPLFIPWGWLALLAIVQVFPAIGMIADHRRYGRVHVAWYYGIAVVVGATLIGEAIAYSPLGFAATHRVIDGTPGAERPMKAFFPA